LNMPLGRDNATLKNNITFSLHSPHSSLFLNNMTTENNTYDSFKERSAERLQPILDKLDFDHEFALRDLILNAYYEGMQDGIDRAFAKTRESNEA